MLLALEDGWSGPDAEDVPAVDVYHGRLEITTEEGVWSGTTGPHVRLGGENPDERIRLGPTILVGSGAYTGHTAYLHFPYPELFDEDGIPGWFGVIEGFKGSFEATVVNRAIPGFPSDEIWLRELRRTGRGE